MKRAVIITGKLVQDHEFIYPYYRLKEEGYSVDVAVNDGKEVLGQIGTRVIPTMDFDAMLKNDFDLILLPGGAKCMEYLRQDKRVIYFIAKCHADGKVISSICHAAQLLISAKIVKGRKISGYYSLKDDIENAGAIYTDEPAVIDSKIITTAHYKDLGPWMRATINAVG
jgi:protease I